jgi:transcriptional regulator with XRE-family HTH domain
MEGPWSRAPNITGSKQYSAPLFACQPAPAIGVEPMPTQFGAKLSHLRVRRGFTQADLTRLLGVRRAHISNLEAGRREPSLDLAVKAAVLFEVPVNYLIQDNIPVSEVPCENQLPVSTVAEPGRQIRTLRIQRGLRQTELATALGIKTQAHISLIESGQKEPSISLLLAAADYFGVSVDDVLFGSAREGAGDEGG